MRVRRLTSISVIGVLLAGTVWVFSSPVLAREERSDREPIVGTYDVDAAYGNPPTLTEGTAVFHRDGTLGWYGAGVGAGVWHTIGTRRYVFTFVSISPAGRAVVRAEGELSRDGQYYDATAEYEALDRAGNQVGVYVGTAVGTRMKAERPLTAPRRQWFGPSLPRRSISLDGSEHEAIVNAVGDAMLLQQWLEQRPQVAD